MRRGIIILIVIGLLLFIGYQVAFKPKRPVTKGKKTTTDTLAPRRKTGRKVGGLSTKEKKMTAEEKKLERKRKREERKRLREERKRRRLEERMRRKALRGKSGKKKGVGLNVLQAIFYSETGGYVIIDGKTMKVNDEIKGRRIVKIEKDRITIEYQGETKQVKVGESVAPPSP